MSQPDQPRPVPGPPGARPGPPAAAPQDAVPHDAARSGADRSGQEPSPFAGLAGRPVAEHVAVFEAEHERLQRELSTVDQL